MARSHRSKKPENPLEKTFKDIKIISLRIIVHHPEENPQS
jgi:hypothetical protein